MKYLPISNSVLILYIPQIKIQLSRRKRDRRYISARKLSRKEKKYNLWDKPFQKDNFDYDVEIETYICSLGEILYRRRTYEYKNNKE